MIKFIQSFIAFYKQKKDFLGYLEKKKKDIANLERRPDYFFDHKYHKYQQLFLEFPVDFKPRHGYGKPPHSVLYDLIASNKNIYKTYLEKFLSYSPFIHKIKNDTAFKKQPCWDNGSFPGLDIAALYSFIAMMKPAYYVEIGSGNSTKVAKRAIKDFNLPTKMTIIDPKPSRHIKSMGDEIIEKRLEDVDDYSFIDRLQANDILFIDNSHRSLPNSDATVCFLEIIPKLRKGVVVHFHDIYLPYDYPQTFCDRYYNEQYLLACFLLASPDYFKIIMPNLFVSDDKELSSIISPIWNHKNLEYVQKHGTSFWLIKN